MNALVRSLNIPLAQPADVSLMPSPSRGEQLVANAFGPMKTRLEAGENVVIFIDGDSTAHSEYGVYYKFALAVGDLYDATVIMHRWAEWGGSSANGPKEYAAPVTLRSGTSQTIDVWLASLPGQVAGCMFEASR